jgi:hypothetical protein
MSVSSGTIWQTCVKSDHLIGLVLANLARQPLRQFQLDHGRDEPVGLFGQ